MVAVDLLGDCGGVVGAMVVAVDIWVRGISLEVG